MNQKNLEDMFKTQSQFMNDLGDHIDHNIDHINHQIDHLQINNGPTQGYSRLSFHDKDLHRNSGMTHTIKPQK